MDELIEHWPWAAAVLLLAVVGIWATNTMAPEGEAATVIEVIDGDTLIAEIDDRRVTVRLLNIDTPETRHPDRPVECLGPEAAAFLVQRLPPGAEIELRYDEERTDHHGRTLAAVVESGALVNAEIAERGLGRPVLYEPNRRFHAEVARASDRARDAGRGLFGPEGSCSAPEPP